MKKVLSKILPASAVTGLRRTRNSFRRSLSQVGQDVWVFGEAFNGKRNGYFVEIGSADGITLSNTFLLEKRFGWTGICVEANPDSFKDLIKARSAKCINVCVGDKEGEVEFIKQGLYSGMVGGDASKGDTNNEQKIKLRLRPLARLLEENDSPKQIDYLSVDVEGAEEQVLLEFPFPKFQFRTMTIERPSQRLKEVLSRNGYLLVKEIPNLDCFYIHGDYLNNYESNMFEYWGHYRS